MPNLEYDPLRQAQSAADNGVAATLDVFYGQRGVNSSWAHLGVEHFEAALPNALETNGLSDTQIMTGEETYDTIVSALDLKTRRDKALAAFAVAASMNAFYRLAKITADSETNRTRLLEA